MIRCKYYKKNHHLRKYLSFHSTLVRYVHHRYRIEPKLYISLSVLSREFFKFCRQYHHCLLHCCCHHSMLTTNCCISARTWLLLLLRYSLFTSVPDGIFFPLAPIFSAIFCCNKFMSVSFIETFVLSWEIFLGISSKNFRDSIGISYRKVDYSKGDVNVLKLLKLGLQKCRRMQLRQAFIVWLVKLGKKSISCCYNQKKPPGLCCFLSITFLCRIVIKYSDIFFSRSQRGSITIPQSINYAETATQSCS